MSFWQNFLLPAASVTATVLFLDNKNDKITTSSLVKSGVLSIPPAIITYFDLFGINSIDWKIKIPLYVVYTVAANEMLPWIIIPLIFSPGGGNRAAFDQKWKVDYEKRLYPVS
jgi:hypothetical protein